MHGLAHSIVPVAYLEARTRQNPDKMPQRIVLERNGCTCHSGQCGLYMADLNIGDLSARTQARQTVGLHFTRVNVATEEPVNIGAVGGWLARHSTINEMGPPHRFRLDVWAWGRGRGRCRVVEKKNQGWPRWLLKQQCSERQALIRKAQNDDANSSMAVGVPSWASFDGRRYPAPRALRFGD